MRKSLIDSVIGAQQNRTKTLTLFVAGSDSPDPDDWSVWDEVALVLAEDADHARRLSGRELVAAIDMGKPGILLAMSEPQMGGDL